MDRAANLRAIKAGVYRNGKTSGKSSRGAGRAPAEPTAPKSADKPAAKKSRKKKAKKKPATLPYTKEELQEWFCLQNEAFTGFCPCGCGEPSAKGTENYRSSAAHLLPRLKFPSVAVHPLNCVERGIHGCHHKFDHMGVDLWPNMADWENIKAKLLVLMQLLTDTERKKKFFHQIEKIVTEN